MGDWFIVLKTVVGVVVMPVPVAFGLALVGLGFALSGWRGNGLLFLAAAVLLVTLASWHPVADALLGPLEDQHHPLDDPRSLTDVEAVVVLAAGWDGDVAWPASVRLGTSSALRLLEAIRLLHALPEARLVVSGASRGVGEEPLVDGYVAAAVELGVPLDRIMVVGWPANTAQEAYAVRRQLGGETRFLLVTSASHMPRALKHFEQAGLSPIPAPTHFLTAGRADQLAYWVPSAGALHNTQRAIYEYLGLFALGLDHIGEGEPPPVGSVRSLRLDEAR